MRHLSIFILSLGIFGCNSEQSSDVSTPEKLVAISWYYPNNAYQHWLSHFDEELSYVNIYDLPDDSVDFYLDKAGGFVLTGGCDIVPDQYGAGEEIARCGKLDPRRDSLELLMVNKAFDERIPVLGVCRGMQIMNVGAGGTLIVDIPTDKGSSIHQQDEGDAYHDLMIVNHTYLSHLTGFNSCIVNSNHHQAIDRLAPRFKVMAYAPDSIIESIIWPHHPFAIGVQWHPERMERDDPIASVLAEDLLRNIESYFASETESE